MSNRQFDRGLMWPPGSYHAVLADGRHVRISLCRTAKAPDRLPFARAERFFRECGMDRLIAGYYHDKSTETWTADPAFDAAVCAGRWPASVEHYRDRDDLPPNTIDQATYIASVPAAAPARRKAVAKAELVAFLRRAERGETTAADATALLAKLAA